MALAFPRTNKIPPPFSPPLLAISPSTPLRLFRKSRPTRPTISHVPPTPAGTLFQFSRRALYFFGALLLCPWLVVVGLILHPRFTAKPPAADTRAPAPLDADTAPESDVVQCSAGPWGDVQYSRLVIEPPDEFTPDDYIRPTPIVWTFPGFTSESLAELWRAARLSDQTIATLATATHSLPDHLVVRPSAELVLGLDAHARSTIYSILSSFPENPDQHEPFRFRADTAEEWFADSGLSPATLAVVQRLLYRRGTSLLFSDHSAVLPLIASRAERLRLIRTLARKSTLLVKLRVSPDSNIEELSDYWGRGPRNKDLRALLKSISKRPAGTTIDISHLLPAFARSHLFTYRPPSTDPVQNSHDCHWTSLNFFNNPPDERFADIDNVRIAFETEYLAVAGSPVFGDIITFSKADGSIIHSCVYIADDIVFTKNGASEVMPWILMNLADVIAFYPADPPLTLSAFRRKDLY